MLNIGTQMMRAAIIFITLIMQNPEVLSHHRNKTLPLKNNSQIRSANRIKISMKGLPKDFFQHDAQQSFIRSNKIRCKTQPNHSQFEQTSYFQQVDTLSPKREGREYKSQQRRRTPCEVQKVEKDITSVTGNNTNVMDCTFFKSVALQSKEKPFFGGYTDSGRIPRKTNHKPTGLQLTDLDSMNSQQNINSILKARECYNLNRLRPGLHRGLPIIRLCKPKVK